MRLWTIQHAEIVESLNGRLHADWQRTSPNFRAAYRWMMHHQRGLTGLLATPVWCWHSCGGQQGRGPTVDTAEALLGDWEYHAHGHCVVELEVPDDLPLLSSYALWNKLLVEAISTQITPPFTSHYLTMFEEPFF